MIEDMDRQLRKGTVEGAVLALLEHEPMYGWQISDILIRHGGIIASIGTLYPVLSRLRKAGLVTTYEEPSPSGPTRKYYRLTMEGTRALRGFRERWFAFSRDLGDLLSGRFSDTAEPSVRSK